MFGRDDITCVKIDGVAENELAENMLLDFVEVMLAGLARDGGPRPQHGLQDADKTWGVESMCVGGGQGMAMVIERLS